MTRKTLAVIVLLAATCALAVWHRYHNDIRAARPHASTGHRTANTTCGLIEDADMGRGPVIFAVHGAGGGFDQSLDLARAFLGPGFRVIAPSRFGYLRTPLPADASPAAQADGHACLLDVLKLQKVVVVGGSMGAPSAMQLCLRHPERCTALILLFPITFAPHPSSEPRPHPSRPEQILMDMMLHSDYAFWAASKLASDTVMKTILATPPKDFRSASAEEQARVLETLRNIEPISAREKGLKNDAAVAPSIPRYEVEKIAVPTLVIAAEDDLFGTFNGGRYTAEHIPGARFVGYSA